MAVILIRELIERNSLKIALSNRNEENLILVINFIIENIANRRFVPFLIEMAKIVISDK